MLILTMVINQISWLEQIWHLRKLNFVTTHFWQD